MGVADAATTAVSGDASGPLRRHGNRRAAHHEPRATGLLDREPVLREELAGKSARLRSARLGLDAQVPRHEIAAVHERGAPLAQLVEHFD